MHKMSYVNSDMFKEKKNCILKNDVIDYTAVTSCVTEMCPPVTFICDTVLFNF